MSITVEAIYEDGVLKPVRPLALKEREAVRITVHASISRARQTAGLVRWTGAVETLNRLTSDPELDPQESP